MASRHQSPNVATLAHELPQSVLACSEVLACSSAPPSLVREACAGLVYMAQDPQCRRALLPLARAHGGLDPTITPTLLDALDPSQGQPQGQPGAGVAEAAGAGGTSGASGGASSHAHQSAALWALCALINDSATVQQVRVRRYLLELLPMCHGFVCARLLCSSCPAGLLAGHGQSVVKTMLFLDLDLHAGAPFQSAMASCMHHTLHACHALAGLLVPD